MTRLELVRLLEEVEDDAVIYVEMPKIEEAHEVIALEERYGVTCLLVSKEPADV